MKTTPPGGSRLVALYDATPFPIVHFGNDAQKKTWLPAVAAGECRGQIPGIGAGTVAAGGAERRRVVAARPRAGRREQRRHGAQTDEPGQARDGGAAEYRLRRDSKPQA